MKCIIGLGNYPEKYAKTRHNIGFMAVDLLAKKFAFPTFRFEKKHVGQVTEGEILGEKVILCKPETYMNLSGKSVAAILQFYKITPKDCFVFQDDLDMDFGRTRFRAKGSAGGHNGIASIIQSIGTQEFSRIKFGITNGERALIPTEQFVLMPFNTEEWKVLPEILEKGVALFLEKIKNKNDAH